MSRLGGLRKRYARNMYNLRWKVTDVGNTIDTTGRYLILPLYPSETVTLVVRHSKSESWSGRERLKLKCKSMTEAKALANRFNESR